MIIIIEPFPWVNQLLLLSSLLLRHCASSAILLLGYCCSSFLIYQVIMPMPKRHCSFSGREIEEISLYAFHIILYQHILLLYYINVSSLINMTYCYHLLLSRHCQRKYAAPASKSRLPNCPTSYKSRSLQQTVLLVISYTTFFNLDDPIQKHTWIQ